METQRTKQGILLLSGGGAAERGEISSLGDAGGGGGEEARDDFLLTTLFCQLLNLERERSLLFLRGVRSGVDDKFSFERSP